MLHQLCLPQRWRTLILPIVLGSLALFAPAAPLRAASVIYVVPGGAGAQTGIDWANAKALQAALLGATSGDQIWVKAGTYTPTTGTDRSATFRLKSGVALYGGFAGIETSHDQRDPAAHASILSGDLLGNDAGAVAIDNPTRNDNSYHVLTADGVNATAILNGLTITAGNASGSGPGWTPDSEGGGLRNNQGSPTIAHVIFSYNSAMLGGGMVNNNPSSPILSQVAFIGNVATSSGGGLVNFGGAPTISQAMFSGNSASYGGGMYNYLSNPIIIHTTFSHNSAPANGGGAIWNGYISSNPVVRNSIFWGNQGGQIITSQGSPDVQFTLVQGGYISGTHILTSDPLFVNADGADTIAGTADDDLRLQAGSPAIDAGNNTFIPADFTDENHNNDTSEAAPFDLNGNMRVVNTTVDMGAYERQGLAITSSLPAASARYGTSYNHTFITDSGSDVTFGIRSGALPPGLTLAPNGVLSGIPTQTGSYSGITVSASTTHNSAAQTFTIVVHKAQLTVAADNKIRIVGAPNPPLTASYNGLANGDTPANLDLPVNLTTTAALTSPPGKYPIIASGAAGANYDITFIPATLTITSGRTYLALMSR